jgi:predicted enzyme related to lactoylglutathione lyase
MPLAPGQRAVARVVGSRAYLRLTRPLEDAMTVRDTPWAPGTPCWVELMTTDTAAAREFYAALLGWEIEVGGEETGYYGSASRDGRRVAGLMGMMGQDHPPVWGTYLATSDVDATSKAVEEAGGTILSPAMDVMEFGRFAVAQLPGGGVFSYWQAGDHIGMELANEPGSVTWNEFMTRDYEGAKDFYAKVFGYTYTDMGGDGFQYSTIQVDGNTVGGMGALPESVPAGVPPHWRVYFAVDDCDATVAQAVELGGAQLGEPSDMPYGRQAEIADPQGARFVVIKVAPQPTA